MNFLLNKKINFCYSFKKNERKIFDALHNFVFLYNIKFINFTFYYFLLYKIFFIKLICLFVLSL
jgi:hypothetical protein